MVAPAARSNCLGLLLRPQLGGVVHRPGAAFERDICNQICEAEQKSRRREGQVRRKSLRRAVMGERAARAAEELATSCGGRARSASAEELATRSECIFCGSLIWVQCRAPL